MKIWIVYDAETGAYMGRMLARDEGREKQARLMWPKVKAFRIEPV